MTKAERHVRENLAEELDEVQHSPIALVENDLTIYEKTLIYHYTKSGYAEVNSQLRSKRARIRSEYSLLLEQALRKLPNHFGIVYRTAHLTVRQINIYREALLNAHSAQEPSFLSTSLSATVARILPRYNTKFQIISKTGKSIEAISYNGSHTMINEKEVLFCPDAGFV